MAIHHRIRERPIGSVDLEEWLRKHGHTTSLAQLSYNQNFGLAEAPEVDQEFGAPALRALTSKTGSTQLRRALARLSEIERRTLVLRYCGARTRTIRSVAVELGVHNTTVLRNEKRALAKLRTVLAPLVMLEEARQRAMRAGAESAEAAPTAPHGRASRRAA